MRPLVLFAVAMSALSLATVAGAEPLNDVQLKALVITDEVGDAWLHDHCSFRGTNDPSVRNVDVPGQIVELVENGRSPLVKEFRCAEQPPFWKGTWAPAPADAVTCTEQKQARTCVPPLAQVMVVPVVVPPPPPPPAVAAPPAPPAPPPPRKPTKAKHAKSSGNAAAKKVR